MSFTISVEHIGGTSFCFSVTVFSSNISSYEQILSEVMLLSEFIPASVLSNSIFSHIFHIFYGVHSAAC